MFSFDFNSRSLQFQNTFYLWFLPNQLYYMHFIFSFFFLVGLFILHFNEAYKIMFNVWNRDLGLMCCILLILICAYLFYFVLYLNILLTFLKFDNKNIRMMLKLFIANFEHNQQINRMLFFLTSRIHLLAGKFIILPLITRLSKNLSNLKAVAPVLFL